MKKMYVLGVSIAAVGLAAGCSDSSEPAGDVAEGAATGDAVELVIDDGDFQLEQIEVPSGQPVTVEVVNKDGDSHDFAVPSQDLNTGTLDTDEVATAVIDVASEPIEFVCTFHDDMRGTIVPVGGGS